MVMSTGYSSGEHDHVKVVQRGNLAVVTIDRVSRRNALALRTMSQLVEVFDRLAQEPDIWTIMLTGAGENAFCAGADLKEADEMARVGVPYPTPMFGPERNVFEVILECPKPTIAAINGVALGAGCELALACDIRLAADCAVFGLPEALRGMGANFASVLLPRLIPRALALGILYSGRALEASEAMRIGLVNEIYPKQQFFAESIAFAEMVARNAPLTLQRYKQMALRGWEASVHSALRLNAGPNPYTSEDRVEGIRAFLEKRAPRWQGK